MKITWTGVFIFFLVCAATVQNQRLASQKATIGFLTDQIIVFEHGIIDRLGIDTTSTKTEFDI